MEILPAIMRVMVTGQEITPERAVITISEDIDRLEAPSVRPVQVGQLASAEYDQEPQRL